MHAQPTYYSRDTEQLEKKVEDSLTASILNHTNVATAHDAATII